MFTDIINDVSQFLINVIEYFITRTVNIGCLYQIKFCLYKLNFMLTVEKNNSTNK